MSQSGQQSQQPNGTATGAPPAHTSKGIVKQVLSGDCIVIRGQPRQGPPPERTLALSNITAPKMGRRGKPGDESSAETKDEPFAWEAREFLRKMLVGKEIMFFVEYKVPSSGREYGSVWLKVDGQPQNVTDTLISEGMVEVRQTGRTSEELQRLGALEAAAKASNKGKWNKDTTKTVRDIVWSMSNDELRTFVEKNQNKQIEAVVEHVRDGSTLRVILLPNFTYLTVAMSGVKSPQFKRDGDKETPEPFAEVARFFVESRLLQRDIKVQLEGVSNQLVLGTFIHPAGNIAELLVKEGFARCVDWSMAFVTQGRDKLRAAEKEAKKKQLRIWKGYTAPATVEISAKSKNFSGKVVEIGNGDNLVVKTPDGTFQKIHFSSLRPPRLAQKEDEPPPSRNRPLYDVPYMFEAREFMRKKLIGKKVQVTVDYIKPAQDGYPQKTCCTVTREGINIAEALISKGLATCLRHRQDDDQRSSCYDDLLAAEARAVKNTKGVHSKKEAPIHRVADVSQDPAKAKQFFPFLQRAGKTVALVEFVASGGRAKLYLSKDTCLINFILAGISCPRAPNVRDESSGEPFGKEALFFTKDLIMHREVEVEVDAVDKGGNFIGWLSVEGKNLSVMLVEEGLCKVLPQAERLTFGKSLFDAEEKAREAKKNIWENYVEPTPSAEEVVEEQDTEITPTTEEQAPPPERKTNYQNVVVTEVESCCHFWAQLADQGPKFDSFMEQLRSDLSANPPLVGAFKPSKGALCVAKFSDGLWYRAKVEKVDGGNVHVLYIDFGNRESVPSTDVATLPAGYSSTPAQAKEYYLACVIPPTDEDWARDAVEFFFKQINDRTVQLNVEYKIPGQQQEFVSLQDPSDSSDIAAKMIAEGLVRVERRRERKLTKLVSEYVKKEEEARSARLNLWCYGDFTPDDAREFGYQK